MDIDIVIAIVIVIDMDGVGGSSGWRPRDVSERLRLTWWRVDGLMVFGGSSLLASALGVFEESEGGGMVDGKEGEVEFEMVVVVALARFETARARRGRGVAGGEAPGVEQGV